MTNEIANLPESKLTKSQTKTHVVTNFRIDGGAGTLKVKIRYDDQCENGHNSFAITADLYRDGRELCGGCLHDDIEEFAPQFAYLIKWHSCSSDGPMHYLANTLYYADEHGAKKGYVYMNDPKAVKEMLIEYCSGNKWIEKYADDDRFSFKLDEKTAKVANLEHARSSAIWPAATIEQLRDKEQLEARLPALMTEFKEVIEGLGYTY